MPKNKEQDGPCDHRWVHLRDVEMIDTATWQQVKKTLFFCEKCLEQRLTEREVKTK